MANDNINAVLKGLDILVSGATSIYKSDLQARENQVNRAYRKDEIEENRRLRKEEIAENREYNEGIYDKQRLDQANDLTETRAYNKEIYDNQRIDQKSDLKDKREYALGVQEYESTLQSLKEIKNSIALKKINYETAYGVAADISDLKFSNPLYKTKESDSLTQKRLGKAKNEYDRKLEVQAFLDNKLKTHTQELLNQKGFFDQFASDFAGEDGVLDYDDFESMKKYYRNNSDKSSQLFALAGLNASFDKENPGGSLGIQNKKEQAYKAKIQPLIDKSDDSFKIIQGVLENDETNNPAKTWRRIKEETGLDVPEKLVLDLQSLALNTTSTDFLNQLAVHPNSEQLLQIIRSHPSMSANMYAMDQNSMEMANIKNDANPYQLVKKSFKPDTFKSQLANISTDDEARNLVETINTSDIPVDQKSTLIKEIGGLYDIKPKALPTTPKTEKEMLVSVLDGMDGTDVFNALNRLKDSGGDERDVYSDQITDFAYVRGGVASRDNYTLGRAFGGGQLNLDSPYYDAYYDELQSSFNNLQDVIDPYGFNELQGWISSEKSMPRMIQEALNENPTIDMSWDQINQKAHSRAKEAQIASLDKILEKKSGKEFYDLVSEIKRLNAQGEMPPKVAPKNENVIVEKENILKPLTDLQQQNFNFGASEGDTLENYLDSDPKSLQSYLQTIDSDPTIDTNLSQDHWDNLISGQDLEEVIPDSFYEDMFFSDPKMQDYFYYVDKLDTIRGFRDWANRVKPYYSSWDNY
tara:strand:- start:3894 stop:6152 length:2259 start_codon:yes stop_codon:yes gene_type:complete